MDELGARVRQIRETQRLSLTAVAQSAGIDPGTLSRLEHGRARRPGHSTMTNLAAALGVSVAELTGEAEPALLTEGAEFAAAHRWSRLVADLMDVDVETHLQTLAELSPAARADIMAYAQWRLQQEHGETVKPKRGTFTSRSGLTPRILGQDAEGEQKQK